MFGRQFDDSVPEFGHANNPPDRWESLGQWLADCRALVCSSAGQRPKMVLARHGVRVLFPHGWGLVRASNTQPVLVLRFEATTPELRDTYRREVEAVVAAAVAAA